jgi:phospholipid/cholesterol/gamma-HCH transport system substrate-binding protein
LRETGSTNIKVGITVLVGIVILIFGIMWAKGFYFGTHPASLTARFPTAGGAERGDPVYYKGMKRGIISDISVNERGDVIMKLELNEKIALRSDATATIMMLELMGGKKIEIAPGTSATAFNQERDTLTGVTSGDLSSIVALGSSLSGDVRSIADKTDSLISSLSSILGDAKVQDDIKGGISEARVAVKDLSETLAAIRGLVAENRSSLKSAIAEIEKLGTNVNQTVTDIGPSAKGAIEDTRAFIAKASKTIEKADIALDEIDKMLIDSRNNKSLLYKLTSDKDFANQIDSTLMHALKMIKEIRYQGLNTNVRMFQGAEPLP